MSHPLNDILMKWYTFVKVCNSTRQNKTKRRPLSYSAAPINELVKWLGLSLSPWKLCSVLSWQPSTKEEKKKEKKRNEGKNERELSQMTDSLSERPAPARSLLLTLSHESQLRKSVNHRPWAGDAASVMELFKCGKPTGTSMVAVLCW